MTTLVATVLLIACIAMGVWAVRQDRAHPSRKMRGVLVLSFTVGVFSLMFCISALLMALNIGLLGIKV